MWRASVGRPGNEQRAGAGRGHVTFALLGGSRERSPGFAPGLDGAFA